MNSSSFIEPIILNGLVSGITAAVKLTPRLQGFRRMELPSVGFKQQQHKVSCISPYNPKLFKWKGGKKIRIKTESSTWQTSGLEGGFTLGCGTAFKSWSSDVSIPWGCCRLGIGFGCGCGVHSGLGFVNYLAGKTDTLITPQLIIDKHIYQSSNCPSPLLYMNSKHPPCSVVDTTLWNLLVVMSLIRLHTTQTLLWSLVNSRLLLWSQVSHA